MDVRKAERSSHVELAAARLGERFDDRKDLALHSVQQPCGIAPVYKQQIATR
jgi:hypothetical protein